LADYQGAIEDPAELGSLLDQTPGVVEHGLFGPQLVDDVIVGREAEQSR
jgi:ribose 5-phosphate isomerase